MIDEDIKSRRSLNLLGFVVAIALVSSLVFITGALVYLKIPTENQQALMIVIGQLQGLVGVIVGYLFGTSVSTKKKDETIATMASTQKSAQAALAPVPGASAAATEIPVAVGDAVTVKAVETP